MGQNPGWVFGFIPTSQQWNGQWGSKLDDLPVLYASPGSGATLESALGQGGWQLTPPGTLTSLTVVAPTGTFEGQQFRVATTQDINNLLVEPAGVQLLNGGTINVLAANGVAVFRFQIATSTWFRWG